MKLQANIRENVKYNLYKNTEFLYFFLGWASGGGGGGGSSKKIIYNGVYVNQCSFTF